MKLTVFVQRFGVLRSGLALLTAVVIAAAPFADGSVHMHDWRLFPSVIAPTILMMLLFVYPLDLVMTRVFMQDAPPDDRQRMRMIMRTEIVLLIVLVAAWLPFMLKVLDFSLFS